MATKKSWKLRYDAFVARVRPDPKSVDEPITIIAGFIGKSSEKGHIRVYFDEALQSFIDLKESDILYAEPLPEDSSPLGGSKLWVKAKAEYQFGDPSAKERPKMSFLRGDIIAAYEQQFGPGMEQAQEITAVPPTIFGPTCEWKTCQIKTCVGKTCWGPTCNFMFTCNIPTCEPQTCMHPTCVGKTCLGHHTCLGPTCFNQPTCGKSCPWQTCLITCDHPSCQKPSCFNKTCQVSCLQVSCLNVSCLKTCNDTCFHYSPKCFLTETIDLDQFGQMGNNPFGGGTGFETFNPYMGY